MKHLVYTDFGNKANRGGLKQVKMENKTVHQYQNVNDPDHCVVNIFDCISARDSYTSIFGHFVLGFLDLANRLYTILLAGLIPEMCKAAGIQGHKTGHSGKVTCAATLYQQNFSDQLIKECIVH